MAENKPKPAAVPGQTKFRIYQALYNLNVAFESIGREMEALDDYHAVGLEPLWRFRVAAEEIRAGLNHRILETLSRRELKEWTLFGREIRKRRKQAEDDGPTAETSDLVEQQPQGPSPAHSGNGRDPG